MFPISCAHIHKWGVRSHKLLSSKELKAAECPLWGAASTAWVPGLLYLCSAFPMRMLWSKSFTCFPLLSGSVLLDKVQICLEQKLWHSVMIVWASLVKEGSLMQEPPGEPFGFLEAYSADAIWEVLLKQPLFLCLKNKKEVMVLA